VRDVASVETDILTSSRPTVTESKEWVEARWRVWPRDLIPPEANPTERLDFLRQGMSRPFCGGGRGNHAALCRHGASGDGVLVKS